MLQNFRNDISCECQKRAFDATTAGIVAHIITYEMALISYSMSHPAQQVVPVSQQPSS